MSRYLTPSKIGLLALISLYTDFVIPSAATIPILSFLVSHVLPPISVSSPGTFAEPSPNSAASIDALQQATVTHASGIPGRTVWDLLLNKLWEINSFDALHVFFENLSSLLQRPHGDQHSEEDSVVRLPHIRLSRVSPLGAFVRRCQLEFTRLQFHDGVSLWKSFIGYRDPTLLSWKRRHQGIGNAIDVNIQEDATKTQRVMNIVYGGSSARVQDAASVSTEDVEKILEFQVDQMQKMGVRMPQEMKGYFRSMVESGVTVPSLSHYVAFLDAWKAGDYPSSFDSLHRYFDYTMHHRDRTFYQYALLNLAILQADFGCFSEAIVAMQEAISTARENDDMGCLNYSLSWLYHFGKEHPEEIGEIRKSGVLGTEKEALAFLKTKAKETSMWSLLSTTLLSEAKLALTTGESISMAFEGITKASHVNVTKRVLNVVGSQMAMQSSIFGRLGVGCQASLYEDLFLQCHTPQSPLEDIVRCTCKSANLLAMRGRYEEALTRMEDLDQETLRILKHYQYWIASMGLLKLQRHLHKDNLVAAKQVLSQLRTGAKLDSDLTFSVSILEIDLVIRRQDYPTAMELLEKLATNLNDQDADVFQRVKLMVLKARIYDKAGTPQKGFSVALRAASMAYKAHVLPALWEAVGAVSCVLISLREFEAAAKLMASIMPQVLECEDCNLAGHSFSTLADAHMGQAGQADANSLQRKEQLTKALEYIDLSFDEFSRVEDIRGQCEMMAKKATIMHLNGDPVLANDCAAKYLDIKRAAREQT